jgi:hypothetical protein|tara:strand:+ start:48 stop:503 length:456 start_codon:yes stop_codon:yes gene_type:complete
MGMDIYGNKPTSPKGEYFRANVWYWRPLWNYCCENCSISQKLAEGGHYNDGMGMNSAQAAHLAEELQNLLDSKHVANHRLNEERRLRALPDEVCVICGGKGIRSDAIVQGECNGCSGKGRRRPFSTWYSFHEEVVAEFIEFLRDSGGFSIN